MSDRHGWNLIPRADEQPGGGSGGGESKTDQRGLPVEKEKHDKKKQS